MGSEELAPLRVQVREDLIGKVPWVGVDVPSSEIIIGRGIDQVTVVEMHRRLMAGVKEEAKAAGKPIGKFLTEDLALKQKDVEHVGRGAFCKFIMGRYLFEKEGVRIDPQLTHFG